MVGELANYMSKDEIANVVAGGALARFQEVRNGKQLENKTSASVKPFLNQVFADHEATSVAMIANPNKVAVDGSGGLLGGRLFDERGYESNRRILCFI